MHRVAPHITQDGQGPAAMRVLVAEDDCVMRGALVALLEASGIDVVAVAGNAQDAIEAAAREQPDVCIIDVRMPGGGGARATREIRLRSSAQVVALSGSHERESVVEMFRAGASGYVVKGTGPDELIEAVRRTARGETTLSDAISGRVVEALTDRLADDDARASARASVADRIRKTVDECLVTMVLQPICELHDRRPVGFEALARFTMDPLSPPDRWFREAGEVGLLNDLERCTVGAALHTLPALARDVFLSVNVSPSALLDPALLDTILESGATERLVIEITEHAPVEHYETLGRALDVLRDAGVRVAIDDAGAGFASLRHILRLRPDLIKMDGELTRHVDTDRGQKALASALIAFARETGTSIVAEGLETSAQVSVLRSLGVELGQGFHLGRPSVPDRAAA